jgi:predicted PurR-regulated permease PerM
LGAPAVQGDEAVLATVAGFLESVTLALRALLIAATIFALAYYWNLESQRVRMWLLRFVPLDRRDRIRAVIEEVEKTVGAFLAGQLLLGLMIGIASLVAYLLIGLPYAVALAVLAGLFELIPLVGPVLGAAAALLVALAYDPSKTIWVVASAVVIQALENYILVPRVVGQSVGVNPLVTLLALLALGSLFGIPGALVAIPLAATLQIAVDRVVFSLDKPGWDAMSARDRLGLLGYEAHTLIYDVRKTLRRKQAISTDEADQVEEAVEGLAVGVEGFVAERRLAEESAP